MTVNSICSPGRSHTFLEQPALVPIQSTEETTVRNDLTATSTPLDAAPTSLEQTLTNALADKCVIFDSNCKTIFSFLSNDYTAQFEFAGRHYKCATAAYEAQKFSHHPKLMDQFTTLDAAQALALSTEKHLEKKPDWYSQRQDRMYHILRAKFHQNPQLRQLLVLTVDSYLSFHSSFKGIDPFWTDNSDGSGFNYLGLFLMRLRKECGGMGEIERPSNYTDLLDEGQAVSFEMTEHLILAALSGRCILFGDQCHPCFNFLDPSYLCSFEFGGRYYKCVTAAYEAQKFSHNPVMMDLFSNLDAEQALALSAEKHHEKSSQWHAQRHGTMYHVLRAKWGQNPSLKHLLCLTADCYLSFHTQFKGMDSHWTDNGNGSGANYFGHLLMQVRSEYTGIKEISRPSDYDKYVPKQLEPLLNSSLSKSDDAIRAEITDLNQQMNEEDYKSHSQIARQSEHLKFNRLGTGNYPYDATLVPLSSGHYMNASFVLGKKFIGTQSPMSHTAEDFWSMVLEHHVSTVIMLNRIGDPGEYIYFPKTLEDKKTYGKIHLKLLEVPFFKTEPSWRQSPREEEFHAVIHRKVKIWRDSGESRSIHHFQYLNWHDFLAANERAVAYLVKTVDSIRNENPVDPVAIHCHAGIGRTSAMITLLDQFQALVKGELDIKNSVRKQRSSDDGRCYSMMQAPDQYAFCYRTLRYLIHSSAED